MARETILVLGPGIAAHGRLPSIIESFGWIAELASLQSLAKCRERRDIAAVMIEPAALNLSWERAIAAVQRLLPRIRIILCHRFSEDIGYAEASAAGAFLCIHVPLSDSELRQALGFVWAAKDKRLHLIGADPAGRKHLSKSAAAAGGASVSEHVA